MIRKNKWWVLGLVGVLVATMFNVNMGIVKADTIELHNPVIKGSVVNKNVSVTYDCVYFGNYWQRDTDKNGLVNKKDKKTPIKWRVLSVEGNDAFIIADQILESKPFNTKDSFVTWENCSLRSWLNSTFIKNAFSDEEQAAIMSVTLKNSSSNDFIYGDGGNDTTDKVFLLSYEDIQNSEYGFTNGIDSYDKNTKPVGNIKYADGSYIEDFPVYDFARIRTDTDFDYLYNKPRYINDTGIGVWWIRHPSNIKPNSGQPHEGKIVDDDGKMFYWGIYEEAGVVPALHLNLAEQSIYKYAGTVVCRATNTKKSDIPKGKDNLISSLTSKVSGQAKIKFDKLKGVDGYELEYSYFRKKNGDMDVDPSEPITLIMKENAKTLKNLKKGKTYVFQIRGYKDYGLYKIYSDWSCSKRVVIKK